MTRSRASRGSGWAEVFEGLDRRANSRNPWQVGRECTDGLGRVVVVLISVVLEYWNV